MNQAVLDEGRAETSTRAVLRSMCCVQEVGENEAGKLEEVGDECSHDEREHWTRGEVVHDHKGVRVHSPRRSVNRGLPIRRNRICLGLGVRLRGAGGQYMHRHSCGKPVRASVGKEAGCGGGQRTGGVSFWTSSGTICTSPLASVISMPREGFAATLANTPSFSVPPPTTRGPGASIGTRT